MLSCFRKLPLVKLVTVALLATGMTSCFTGVEGTSKITLSKKDIHIIAPTEEEVYLRDVQSGPLKQWTQGRRFLITDEKFRFVVSGNTIEPINKGDTIFYDKTEKRYSAGGGENTLIMFRHKGEKIAYPLERKMEAVENDLTSDRLPMLIDLEMVEAVKAKLKGKRLWTRSALWYDDSLVYGKGKKFVEVIVDDVKPGNTFFPLIIKFTDEENNTGHYLMNTGTTGNESRGFDRLFYLSDPRTNYKQINDENWKAIQNEELRLGMTKEECRLSKGNPADMDSGHNYSNTMEIWKYSDGSILRFVDGLLISF